MLAASYVLRGLVRFLWERGHEPGSKIMVHNCFARKAMRNHQPPTQRLQEIIMQRIFRFPVFVSLVSLALLTPLPGAKAQSARATSGAISVAAGPGLPFPKLPPPPPPVSSVLSASLAAGPGLPFPKLPPPPPPQTSSVTAMQVAS